MHKIRQLGQRYCSKAQQRVGKCLKGNTMKSLTVLVLSLLLSACAGLPEGIEPVSGFRLDQYLGKWYEIARLDHRFERGLEQVTATYSMKEDGSVSVANSGFSLKESEWKEAMGRARFFGSSGIGHLEVSFFGPFYANYIIFELDSENYQYAFVTGNENTLWLLSRTPQISDELKDHFLSTARRFGYNSEELIFVNQK
jgi:apolipoprotein D and lipocalin family protein